MSAICGVVNLDGAPVGQVLLERMAAASPYRGPDGTGYWHNGYAGLAHLAFHLTPESVRERQPLVSADRRLVLVADVRLDNRGELIHQLAPGEAAQSLTDPDLVLKAYLRWGTDCVSRLLGDFVFAIWDSGSRELFLARDVLGAHSLTVFQNGRRFLFASETTAILESEGVEPRINQIAVTKWLAGIPLNADETFFDDVHYLAPAHCMLVSSNGTRQWRYWDIDPERRIRYRGDDEYAEHFLELLTDAVDCRLRTVGPVGISLSGGCDSTLIAAIASKRIREGDFPQEQLKSFSYVFDRYPSCDERTHIEAVVEHCALDATWIVADDCLTFRNFHAWPLSRDFFSYNCYVQLPETIARTARQAGCRVLLGGHYGDALCIGPSYVIADMLHDGCIREAVTWLKTHAHEIDWKRELLDYGVRPLLPAALRNAYRRARPRRFHAFNPGIAPARLEALRESISQQSDIEAPGRCGPTQRRLRALLLSSIWGQDLASGRANLSNRFGVERVSPYLDRRLVEYVVAIPSERLNRPGWDRGLQRHAMRRLLPASICNRVKDTDYVPLLEQGLVEAGDGVVRRLARRPLVLEQGWVIPEWFGEQLAAGPGAANRGLPLSVFLHLELWLRGVADAQRSGCWSKPYSLQGR